MKKKCQLKADSKQVSKTSLINLNSKQKGNQKAAVQTAAQCYYWTQ